MASMRLSEENDVGVILDGKVARRLAYIEAVNERAEEMRLNVVRTMQGMGWRNNSRRPFSLWFRLISASDAPSPSLATEANADDAVLPSRHNKLSPNLVPASLHLLRKGICSPQRTPQRYIRDGRQT